MNSNPMFMMQDFTQQPSGDQKSFSQSMGQSQPQEVQIQLTLPMWLQSNLNVRMDQNKSETEEMTFPFVCFSVDDHEEAWSDIIVRYVT